jgi:aspartyl-tRNA(Asn)/glutamyl-tRNA(Gln) amidotransferase subunit A
VLTLREIQQQLQLGKLTCHNVVKQFLENINSHAHLNAFLSVYEKEAFQRAAEIDSKIKIGKAGKLAGLVVSLKDVIAHQGHPLQAGSKILEGFTAPYHDTAVQRLLNEDAIIIGRTNCDEFGMGSSNENSAFGPVLNAIDTTRVPGGSSGGSAVAVQAGLCHISLGSDTGGSVRQPAAFCGVIGFKPTYSRISRYGLVAYGSSFDCIGVLGKTVEDIARVTEVISGADEFDSTVSQQPVPDYVQAMASPAQPYKIAYLRESLESDGLQPGIRKNIMATLDALREQGHTVDALDLPLLQYALPAYYILATAEASSNLSRYDGVRYGYRSENTTDLQSLYKKTRSEGFGKEVKRRILLGTFVLSSNYYDAYYTKAQKARRILRNKTLEIFKQYDFLVMPTTPTTAFKLGEHSQNPMQMYLGDLYSVQANVAGVPAISVPCGTDSNGLPVGLQIMANDFEEPKLFQFAERVIKMNSA